METVIIVIHLMVIVALIAVVLMQRSEGGALGIGGGGGNFMSSRGQTNVLTRTTGILAAAFFATSIALTLLSRFQDSPASILDNVQADPAPITAEDTGGADGATGNPANAPGILDELQAITPVPTEDSGSSTPQVPTSQ